MIPYLSPQAKEEFLHDHKMIDSPLTEEDHRCLSSINFHFLMGYTRNYRALVDSGKWEGPKNFGDIRGLLDAETELSGFLASWIHKAEQYLRALTVTYYCSVQGHGCGYMEWDKWEEIGEKGVVREILKNIRRHHEPYLDYAIKERAATLGIAVPGKHDRLDYGIWHSLLEEIPLWATIDSFTVGTLSQFLNYCEIPGTEGGKLSTAIAQELGVSKNHFSQVMHCFSVTRNLLFHQQRLWMRPVPVSPGVPKHLLRRRYQGEGFKDQNREAHFIALINISQLLPRAERTRYLDSLDSFMQNNELYRMGIMESPFSKTNPNRRY